jgi:predicted transcriptional regulator
MACINPDGTVTRPGRKMLDAMKETRTLEEVAQAAEIPLYRVRSVIRELLDASLTVEKDGKYTITEAGLSKLK